VPLGVPCPKCGGDLIEIRGKKRGGRPFYGCVNYANEAIKCDFKLWQKPIKEPCPLCASPFLVQGGNKNRPLIVCANKECGYKRAVEPEGQAVPAALPAHDGVPLSSPPPA
jgi:DNA topoisomerase-1